MNERPNIVLVTIDSLRADYCGYGSNERDATPTLTRMANEGLAFERAVAPGPSTPESMPTIFTGQYPIQETSDTRDDLTRHRDLIRHHMLARDTIPERLSRRGYSTAAFTPNPFTSHHFGFDQGFDHFQDFLGEERETNDLYDRVFEGFLEGDTVPSIARILMNFWQREEVFKPWESYYDEVVKWASTAEEPYFLWVFLMDAHNPYLASDEYRSQSRFAQFHANFRFWWESHETPFAPLVHDRLVTAYEDAVRYSDGFLERLRADLAPDAPLFVVHGDHGEAFGEHGTYGHEPYLYPENVHVPLVVHGGPTDRIAEPVSLRTLPRLIRGLVTDAEERTGGNPYGLSRTLQGESIAIYTGNGQYIANREGKPVSNGIEDEPGAFECVLKQFEESQREKTRVVRAAADVTES